MKCYHGSPSKIEILVPRQARGNSQFQNLNAVFLTDNLFEAKLYAIGKSLKGKTQFGVNKKNLIIVGYVQLNKAGYVYEFNIPKEELIAGKEKSDIGVYAYQKPLRTKEPIVVNLNEIKEHIIYVQNESELIKILYE